MQHRKTKFIMLILSFWSLFSIAQKSESHYFTELSIGTSIPIGGFASKTYNGKFLDNANGIAKVGIALNIYTGYRINKTFGLVFMAGGSQNKQDSNTFYNYLKKERNPAITIIETNEWRVGKLMLGGFIELPFEDKSKLSFRGSLLAGICKTAIPKYQFTYVTAGAFPIYGSIGMNKISLPWTFCYQVGASLKYSISKKIHLLANLNYFYSTPVYKYSINPNSPNPGELVAAKKRIILSTIELTVGAGINF